MTLARRSQQSRGEDVAMVQAKVLGDPTDVGVHAEDFVRDDNCDAGHRPPVKAGSAPVSSWTAGNGERVAI